MFEEQTEGRYTAIRSYGSRYKERHLDTRTEHVLICGTVFIEKDKGPFRRSGVSLLGALQYDQQRDEIKCHECGEFLRRLASHITKRHGINAREYKNKHGLNMSTRLGGVFVKMYGGWPGLKLTRGQNVGGKARHTTPASPESLNARNNCSLQLISRIRELAGQLGYTPTHKQLMGQGIHGTALKAAFGSEATALRVAGLTPRQKGMQPTVLETLKGVAFSLNRITTDIQ